jgi:hypothetical protein
MRKFTPIFLVSVGISLLFGSIASADPVYAIAQDLDIHVFFEYGTATPNTIQSINSNFSPGTIYGIDFNAAGTLYGINNSPNEPGGRSFGEIDPGTGTYTKLESVTGIPSTEHISGLAINHTDGVFYVSTTDALFGPSGSSSLYTVNPATGVATLVGTETTASNVEEIAFDPLGHLFAIDVGTQSLYSMDPSTAAVSLIGGIAGVPDGQGGFFEFRDMTGMKFDQNTGVLYAVLHFDTSDGAFVSLNPTNAKETVLSTLHGALTEEIAIPFAVPEPGTFPLLAIAVVALMRRNRRK